MRLAEPRTLLDELCVNAIRTLAIDAVEEARSGHPGAPMGLAPAAYVLWTRIMRHNPLDPAWPNRDRFVLSAGHASMLLYALLHLTGYELSLDDLRRFRRLGSRTPGHPEFGHTPGVETTTGPLGQGIANAVGMAVAERILAGRFNRPGHDVVDHHTFVVCSDGDLMEGVSAEAASLAGHLGLSKLVALYDDNGISIDGPTDLAYSEDAGARFRAYGWNVVRVADGTDLAAIEDALIAATAPGDRPTLIAVRTHIGHGSPGKQDTAAAHGAPLGPDEAAATKRALGWTHDPFSVPPEVGEVMSTVVDRGPEAENEWRASVARYCEAEPGLGRALLDALDARAAEPAPFPAFEAGTKMATRKASGSTLAAVWDALPWLVGGSADLAESTNTKPPQAVAFTRTEPGRYLHFGVREHAMGGIMNGIALHGGLRPFGGTFLVFSDYMRPSIRLAALMRLPVTYVFTHDSIGLGEDGPTHQPVEHLMSLRAIPGLVVIRPADANETAEAWRYATRSEAPVALVLSRQDLPVLERPAAADAAQGAYALETVADPDVVLVATGSEVAVARDAAAILAAEGTRARVVSMPSWELFEAQPPSYRTAVLPPGVPRVSVEAGTTFGWSKWVGRNGLSVGIDRFGASAPGEILMAAFGFTPENVADHARKVLGR